MDIDARAGPRSSGVDHAGPQADAAVLRQADAGSRAKHRKATGRSGKAAVAAGIRNRRLPAAVDGAGPADQCAGDICIYAHAEAAAARAGATAADTDDTPNDTPNADRDK